MPEPFTADDGNGWWSRNATPIHQHWHPENDWPCRLLSLYRPPVQVAVEVGCSDGYRLAYLAATHPNSRCIGVDISSNAIADGRQRYPDLELRVANANHLPIANTLADLVIVYFVFHWIDRDYLRLCAQEVDRVLKPGGVLILGDFAPDSARFVPYKHRDGVLTYKTPDSYSLLFESLGHYRQVARITFDHDTHEVRADVPSDRRAACILLHKYGAM